jgi:hypothetical protein
MQTSDISGGLKVAGARSVDAPAAAAWRRDRYFFTGMAVAAALTVFCGFAPTYYLKGLFGPPAVSPALDTYRAAGVDYLKGPFGTPALSFLLHFHGLLYTSWILLFVAQTTLVAAKRTDLHRRLGVVVGLIAVLLPVVGLEVAVWSARRGFTPPGGPPPLVFLAIPVGDVLVFSILVGTGLYLRRRSETHKRLMLLANIGLLTPAIARLPHVAAAGPPAFLGLTDLFIVVCLVYDRLAHGRVHRAFWWGGLFIIVSQPLRLLIAQTGAWLSLASWLTR